MTSSSSSSSGPRFVYVTRLPPSPSGVALYASVFADVLRALGDVAVVRLPAAPESSQSLWCGVRLFRSLRRASRVDPEQVLHFEIAGRGVAEFWAAWALARSGRRVWLTVHDVPALSGGGFFVSWLDRPGRRAVAAQLSRTLGARAERTLLSRAERVFCLSAQGARALERRHGLSRQVEPIPHVARPTVSPLAGRREILVPGYIASELDFVPLVQLLPTLPAGWTLVIGACAPDAQNRASLEATAAGVEDRVHLLGFSTEDELQAAFERAAVVVRWRRQGWSAGADSPGSYAVSGPLISAMASGCAIVTDDTRGTSEYFAAARVVEVDSGDLGERQMTAAVGRLVRDEQERLERGEAGRQHVRRVHSVAAVADVVRGFV